MGVLVNGCVCVFLCVCWVAQDGATPACIASHNGEHKCLELLIAAGAGVNRADKVRGGCPTDALLPP